MTWCSVRESTTCLGQDPNKSSDRCSGFVNQIATYTTLFLISQLVFTSH